ncbi:hypothetical protein SLEP1_g36149 [Rubroshorea leprosula]|uniref:Uncharacterized protein n=1 Tax=Rubroshorea leprosula TaxID=152421 RepID=A0AAV5KR79_9ROSI|nr:hypothetical protein SLEP1_g36149 [Rubroshorea leprosula]
MKLRFLPWLLFFIWANGFVCLGIETYPAIEYENFNFSTAIFRGKEIQGLSKRIDLAAEGGAKVNAKKNDVLQPIGRRRRGKGGFGGANTAHGRRRKRSAAASLVRPDLSVSAARLLLMLILPPFFLRLV